MPTILVTGASGFIAKHITRELLADGYRVRASVRSERRRAEIEELFPEADLEFVSLDLTRDAGWAEALQGVDALCHTASPFPANQPKDPQDVIRPAVDGTMRALRAAQAAGVRRVVLTSSCAAVYKDSTKPREAISTRDNWTDPDDKGTTAYEASKTLAERAAWDFASAHPEMELTTINPGIVMGPPMDLHFGTSLGYVEEFLAGRYPAVPPVTLPIVDVRDVARMHVAALSKPVSVGKRYPANAKALTMVDIAKLLKRHYPGRRISSIAIPVWLVRLLTPVVPLFAQIVDGLTRNLDIDASDAERELEFRYIPADDSILASAEYLVAHGK
ncbi:MAG: NAD-dependent epimerase/dehydratase family protein [Arachnia sp.]